MQSKFYSSSWSSVTGIPTKILFSFGESPSLYAWAACAVTQFCLQQLSFIIATLFVSSTSINLQQYHLYAETRYNIFNSLIYLHLIVCSDFIFVCRNSIYLGVLMGRRIGRIIKLYTPYSFIILNCIIMHICTVVIQRVMANHLHDNFVLGW